MVGRALLTLPRYLLVFIEIIYATGNGMAGAQTLLSSFTMRRPSALPILLLLLLLLAGGRNAMAVVLDWDTVTWTNGSLSNTYDIDPANSGNDVTVSVSGNTSQLGSETTGEMTPALTTNLTGGLSPRQKTLTIFIDLTSTTQSVTVFVDFTAFYPQGVENLSFRLFDIDFANEGGNGADFRDQLRGITGTAAVGGGTVSPTITTSAGNTLTGTGVNQVVDGIATVADTSADGTVLIDFGATAIRSFTFTYGSGATQKSDPTGQHMGLHDITFTPVPEINPALAGTLSCLAATGLMFFHRARVKSRRQ